VSVAPITSSLSPHQPPAAQATSKPIRQDARNIATASTSGDLAGAREAFAAIQKLLEGTESDKTNQSQGGGNNPQNQLGTDLFAFGKALLSGDLGSGLDSVKNLIGDIRAARSRYQHPAQVGEGAISSAAPAMRASSTAGSKSIGSLINTSA
jgi:hypothetical protein